MTHKIRILFLASNSATGLALDQQQRAIVQKLQAGTARDKFELVSLFAVRTDDLQEALLRWRPHVVHFCGYGAESGGLTLVNLNV